MTLGHNVLSYGPILVIMDQYWPASMTNGLCLSTLVTIDQYWPIWAWANIGQYWSPWINIGPYERTLAMLVNMVPLDQYRQTSIIKDHCYHGPTANMGHSGPVLTHVGDHWPMLVNVVDHGRILADKGYIYGLILTNINDQWSILANMGDRGQYRSLWPNIDLYGEP